LDFCKAYDLINHNLQVIGTLDRRWSELGI
jgi:hypothetical protein